MTSFCVFGISKSVCKQQAEKKTPNVIGSGKNARSVPIAEWAAMRDEMAAKLFETDDKRVKVSPEFDAPQFCKDWLAAGPGEVRQPLIMVRAEKVDKGGERMLRKGQPVMTWVEYVEPRAELF